jgi:hypothetical protein
MAARKGMVIIMDGYKEVRMPLIGDRAPEFMR